MEGELIAGISNELIVKLAILLIVVLLTWKLINAVSKAINSKMNIGDGAKAKGLINFIKAMIIIVVALTCMSTLGINTSNILAVLAAMLVAIVIALKDYLSNIAGGVMILTLKPFKIGDLIICDYGEGYVETIMLLHTEISTYDKKVICIPNGLLANSAVTNTTKNPLRRIDIETAVAYGTDFNIAKQTIMDVYRNDPDVHQDMDIKAFVTALEDSSITIKSMGFVDASKYWEVRFRLIEGIANELPKAGVSIPFNQLDVHMKND